MGLFPYQLSGVEFLAACKAAFLLDDPGLGKSAQAIRAADKAALRKILVLCPAIARVNWQREVVHWQGLPRTVKVLMGSADAADLDADVLVCSYSLLISPEVREALMSQRYALMILDEAQHLKSREAVRTKAVYGRTGLITRCRRAWLLSGTLMPNAAHEAWTHLRALGLTKLDYWPLVDRFCTVKETAFGRQITGTNRARSAELAGILKPHTLRRRQQDVLAHLPALRWGHVTVAPDEVPPRPDLSPDEQRIIDRVAGGGDLASTDGLHLSSLRRWTGIAKAPAVAEVIQADGVRKLVVFAIHREVISIIAEALGDDAAVLNGDTPLSARQTLIDAFQNQDQPRVLICQVTVAGTAITLTRASHVVFAELPWVPADVAQAAKRCHRLGQTNPVLARVINLAGSIDETVAAIVTRKAAELAELEGHLTERAA